MAELKARPNHREYLQILKTLTPAQRVDKMFELSSIVNQLLRESLKKRFPEKSDPQLHVLFLQRLHECHNRNY